MMNNLNITLDKIKNAKGLDFGDVFNNCINLFKKVWLQAFVTMILTGVLFLPFYFLMYVPLLAIGIMDPESFESGVGLNAVAISFIVLMAIVLFLVAIIITTGMRAALYRICKQKDLSENKGDDYFFFFKKKYFKKTVALGLSVAGIVFLSLLLFILPVIYVSIPIAYMTVIYAGNPDLTPNEIIKAGFALGNKKWFFTFFMVIVAWFVSLLGLILCVVGVYFTQQFVILPFYEIYKQVIGFDDKSEIEQIGAV